MKFCRSRLFGLTLLLSLSTLLWRCAPPFSTASSQWRIRFDRRGVEAKSNALVKLKAFPDGGQQPNIVLIVADDLGKFDVSAYGFPRAPTPHIDQLAAEGVRFADAYVTSPVCSPSRAGMLTGRHQARFGFETQPMEYYPNNLAVYWLGKHVMNTDEWVVSSPPSFPSEWQAQRQGLPPSEITLPELLKQRGYRTGAIGKWHLGHSNRLIPTQRGFDYHYGFYGAFSLYTPQRRTAGYVGRVLPSLSSRHQWRTGRRSTAAIRRNEKLVSEKEYLTFALRDEAIHFIEKNKETPFFLYLGFSAPHEPFQAPQTYYDRFAHIQDDHKRLYYAMVAALDDAVGEIHRRIRELGIENNTLIFFTSDNGGASYTHVLDNAPYKGGKLTMFEGGVNVPFLAKWPDRLPAGAVYKHPVSTMDIFATAAAAAGCPLPDDRVYDGIDLLPFAAGEKQESPHRYFYWKAGHIQAMRRDHWKFLHSSRDGWTRLFNLENDPYEENDLHTERPDILEQLLNDYRQWEQTQPPAMWPGLMDHLFIIDGDRYLFPA